MFRFEYDRVVGYHPYRTDQPWDLGGVRLLHVDGVNIQDEERRLCVAQLLRDLESRLLLAAQDAGFKHARADNHYGFTVLVEGSSDPLDRDLTYYQLRFSDGSLYVWLMPGPPSEWRQVEGLGMVCDVQAPLGGRTQAEVDALAEARVDGAIARDQGEGDRPLRPADEDPPVLGFAASNAEILEAARAVPRRPKGCPCRFCSGPEEEP